MMPRSFPGHAVRLPVSRTGLRLLCLWVLCTLSSIGAVAGAESTAVVKAESGLFGPADQLASAFTPSKVLPLRDGQAFGWRMQVKTPARTVRVREELTLPAEPKTWGDPEPGLKRKTSPDGRTATTELVLEPRNGVISQSWTVTRGDPPGTWVIRVRVDDGPEVVFRFEAR